MHPLYTNTKPMLMEMNSSAGKIISGHVSNQKTHPLKQAIVFPLLWEKGRNVVFKGEALKIIEAA